MQFSKLMQPIQVGHMTWKNRIVMAAMETRLSNPLGDVTQEMCDYYAERARGGAAAIIVENTFVDNIAARSSLSSSGLYSSHLISGKYRLAQAIKAHGAAALIQISHGGPQANIEAVPGQDALGPSAVESKIVGRMPRELTLEEIETIEDAFVQAAVRAKHASFDGVELHGAHGYLICSFLSPYTNQRTDKYGGCLENRTRFVRNIIRKVREAVGDRFIVGLRLSGAEFIPGGLTIEDTTALGRMVCHQVDYIHVSAGNYDSMADWMITPMYRPSGLLLPLAAAMKQAVAGSDCKVITVNSMNPFVAEKALEQGCADLTAFARPLLADPYLPAKIKAGRAEEIRPCLRGNCGCMSLFFEGCPIRCEVNPQAGQELNYRIQKVEKPKRVVVIGGGIAGMEAARVASQYGHNVTLFERTSQLGGHFIEASAPKHMGGARAYLDWQRRELAKSGAYVLTNTEATPYRVAARKPDALIIAVGSDYALPAIPGIQRAITPETALTNPGAAGGKVVVLGGSRIGADTALALARQGLEVTLLEQGSAIVPELEPLSQTTLQHELAAAKVTIITNAEVSAIDSQVIYRHGGRTCTLPADTVVAAFGLKARTELAEKLSALCEEYYIIGDAVEARNIFACTHDAWNAVRRISDVF